MKNNTIIGDHDCALHDYFFYRNPIGSALYDAQGALLKLNLAMKARFSLNSSDEFFLRHLFEDEILFAEEKRRLKEGLKIQHSLPYNFSVEPVCPEGACAGYILFLSDVRILANDVLRKSGVTVYTFSFLRFNQCDRIHCQRCFQFYGSDNKLLDKNKFICRALGKLRHPEDSCDFFFLFNEIRNRKLPGLKVHFRLKEDNGEYHDFEVSGAPFHLDEEGKATLIAGSIVDDQEHLDKEHQLQTECKKAEESEQLKSSLFASISHDIRSPLNAILGFSDLLSTETDLELRENYCNMIRENQQLLLRLINDVLDLSKLESGKMTLSYSSVSLPELMAELYAQFRWQIPQDIQFVSDPCEAFVLNSDKARLIQIIQNLIINAKKYTMEGSIHFGYRILSNEVEFYVTDTGRGIPEDQLEKIFERYIQGSNAAAGHGLGLSICKRLVTKMGGTVRVQSKEGVGSTFSFTLPVTQQS